MAVLSRPFLNNTAYSFDEATGRISPKDDFDGTNILIKLKLDRSKADPEKAREYLDGLKESGNDGGGETADGAEETAESSGESESAEIYGNGEFSIETDKSEGETSVVITGKEG